MSEEKERNLYLDVSQDEIDEFIEGMDSTCEPQPGDFDYKEDQEEDNQEDGES